MRLLVLLLACLGFSACSRAPAVEAAPGRPRPSPEEQAAPAPTTQAGAESAAESDAEPTSAEHLAKLLAGDIPAARNLPFGTDLTAGLRRASEVHCPLVHFQIRGADDPDWVRLLGLLDLDRAARGVLTACALVVTAESNLALSPTVAVYATEPITSRDGRFRTSADGASEFVVESVPGAPGFVVPGAADAGALAIESVEGRPIFRHRVVDIVAGASDAHALGARVWSVVMAEYPLDKLRGLLSAGRASESEIRQLLGDDYFGLLTADQRIQAVTLLLARGAQDLWAVQRAALVMFGEDVRDPTELLELARALWKDEAGPQRLLLESQVELFVHKNRQGAMALLEQAIALEPESPYLHERMARAALVAASAGGAGPTPELLESAANSLEILERVAPRLSDLWNLRALYLQLSCAADDRAPTSPDAASAENR